MRFTIKSSEKLPIRGNLEIPRGARALVILIHGFKGFKDWGFFPWLAEVLCDAGFAVCRFNIARSGIGKDLETFDRLDLFADGTFSGELDDLQRVVDHCQDRIALPTFLCGHSLGGGAAIIAAEKVHSLRGVVTWSAVSNVAPWDAATVRQWRKDGHLDVLNTRTAQVMRISTRLLDDLEANRERFDVLRAAARLEVPLLVIHGGKDESVPVSDSQEIAAVAPECARVVISGASHTYNAVHPLVHVPRALMLAADITASFVGVYS